jgi:uncharacterized protein
VRIFAAPARSSLSVAEPDDYRVVHSSRGRLRVHLVNWLDSAAAKFIARLQAVPGVTSAAATPITQNVLILYDPRRTNQAVLLEEVADAWQVARPPVVEAVLEALAKAMPLAQPLRSAPHNGAIEEATGRPGNTPYVTGLRRTVYKVLGWASVGMAFVGILPGIPTVPFVILAGYFFMRSSPSAHQWLQRSRWFGLMLRDWEEQRGVRRSVRNAAAGLLVVSMVLITLLGWPLPLTLTILTMQLIGLVIVLRLRVVEQPSPTPALVAP